MIQRFFSIKFPANAQLFNKNGINGASVIDCWSLVAQRFTSVPAWVYTKTKASSSTKEKSEYIPSEEAIELFIRKNEIGKREFAELKSFAKNDLYVELKKIEASIKVY